MRTLILFLLLYLSFPVLALQAEGSDSRICAPFRGGIVDPVIINAMLQAAEEGHLYRIQANNSKVGFCVNSSIGRVEAEFTGIQGGMALRREVWGDESHILVMVDANSLGREDDFVINMLKSKRFLDTYTYTRILFVSTQIRWLDLENGILEGDLTMHGVTRPVRFDIKLAMAANDNSQSVTNIVVTAKSFIDRSDFNMDRLTNIVNNRVELCMRIEAELFRE